MVEWKLATFASQRGLGIIWILMIAIQSAYQFQFFSLLSFDSNNVNKTKKHLDIKNIYYVFLKNIVAAEKNMEKQHPTEHYRGLQEEICLWYEREANLTPDYLSCTRNVRLFND